MNEGAYSNSRRSASSDLDYTKRSIHSRDHAFGVFCDEVHVFPHHVRFPTANGAQLLFYRTQPREIRGSVMAPPVKGEARDPSSFASAGVSGWVGWHPLPAQENPQAILILGYGLELGQIADS